MLGTIISWILIGVLAGFFVAFVFPDSKKYLIGTISFGVIGAMVGGIVYSAFRIGSLAYSLNPASLLLTVLFAVFFIFSLKLVTKN